MKKLLALMLAAALALSLVACGGGSGAGDNNSTNTPSGGNGETTSTDTPSGGMTKEEMLEQAESIDIQKIYWSASDNKVNAEDTYKGNIYTFAGFIDTIESDYIEIYNTGKGNYTTRVYMNKDDIKKVSSGQWIEIVGEISVVDSANTTGEYGVVYTSGVEVTSAYLVTDTFDVTGKLIVGHEAKWEIQLNTSDNAVNSQSILSLYKESLSLEKEVELKYVGNSKTIDKTAIISGKEIEDGANITISCKIITPDLLRDITLVSIN